MNICHDSPTLFGNSFYTALFHQPLDTFRDPIGLSTHHHLSNFATLNDARRAQTSQTCIINLLWFLYKETQTSNTTLYTLYIIPTPKRFKDMSRQNSFLIVRNDDLTIGAF